MNDYFGILGVEGRGTSSKEVAQSGLNIQTQIRHSGQIVKVPALQSRLHVSSLLYQQFGLCRDLKGASEHRELSACGVTLASVNEREERIPAHSSDPKLWMTHCFPSGWTHSCPPACLLLNSMGIRIHLCWGFCCSKTYLLPHCEASAEIGQITTSEFLLWLEICVTLGYWEKLWCLADFHMVSSDVFVCRSASHSPLRPITKQEMSKRSIVGNY